MLISCETLNSCHPISSVDHAHVLLTDQDRKHDADLRRCVELLECAVLFLRFGHGSIYAVGFFDASG